MQLNWGVSSNTFWMSTKVKKWSRWLETIRHQLVVSPFLCRANMRIQICLGKAASFAAIQMWYVGRRLLPSERCS